MDVKRGKKRITRVVASLKEARQLEEKLKSALEAERLFGVSVLQDKNQLNLQEFYEKYYLPRILSQSKNPETLKKKSLSLFRKWFFERFKEKALSEVSRRDVEKTVELVLSEGFAPRTAQHVLALIKSFYSRAVAWGFVKENPAKGVRVPRFDNRRTRFLTYEEAQKLLEECRRRETPRNRIYSLVLTALSTGMRAGELFNLTWQDVDFEQKIIYIRDTKSGKNRIAFMSEELEQELRKLEKETARTKSAYVFAKPNGQPFKEVPDVFKNIVRDLEFNKEVTDPREKVVFHTLRHTFCSWLALEGVPLHVIKELAGHSSIQMTERYAHLLPDMRKKAAEKVWEKIKLGFQSQEEPDK